MTSETRNGSSAEGADKGPDANLPPSTFTSPTVRANSRWEENAARVLGEEFKGKWSSIYEMVFDLKTAGPCRDQNREGWTQAETERAARLICWGLTNETIGKILGRTGHAVRMYVRRNQDIVDVFREREENVLKCQAPGPAEEEEEA